jgi:SRSO17 transposase
MLWRSGAWRPYGWTAKEAKPIQYCLANLPKKTKRTDLVAAAKQCSIIECDYQELEQELGWGHYERRGWRGFHHHATLSIAAYGFLVAERAPFFSSARLATLQLSIPKPPRDVRPRGAPDASRTA